MQEVFAREYVIDRNATRAAIAAGYSEHSAGSIGSQLLKRLNVKKLIDQHTSRLAKKADATAEKVLQELQRLAFSNMKDYIVVKPDGQADIDFSMLTRDQAASIQEIKVDTTGGTGDGERRQVLRTTFKLADKGQNLERLGRHLKLFTDIVRHEGLESLVGVLGEKEQ
jgi:phage terminase small subunit